MNAGPSHQHDAKPPLGPVGLARRRAALTLLFFCIGLLTSWQWPDHFDLPPSGLCFGLAILTAGTSLALGKKSALVALSVAMLLFGAGWGILRLRERDASAIGQTLNAGETRILRLTLLETPRRTTSPESGRESWTCLARCRGIVLDSGDVPATGRVWLRVPDAGAPPRFAGDRLIVRGTFRPVQPPRNPGEFDLERWARDRGIEGSFAAFSAAMVRPDESKSDPLARTVDRCRAWWLRGIEALRACGNTVLDLTTRDAGDDTKEVLRGLLLGEEPIAPSDGLRAFYRLGLAHILSISGFHLVVFAGAVLFCLRLFGDLGKLEALLIALAILLFLALIPASSPLIRAAAILLTLLFAEFFGRRYDRLTLLCWVALAILVVRPSELWSLGFQLSFGLAAALLGLNGKLLERLLPRPLGKRASEHGFRRWVAHACRGIFVTSLLCWGLSAPWIAMQIGILNPIAVLTGMLITPAIAVILWIGYAALLIGMVVPGAASATAFFLTKLADICVNLVIWFDSLPGATVQLPRLSAWWAASATVLLAYWFWKTRLRERACLAIAGLLLIWGAAEIAFTSRLGTDVTAQLIALDVTHGGCVIVRNRDCTVMVGAGSSSPRGRDLPVIARRVGAWRISDLLLRANDDESASGAASVIRSLSPSRLVLIGEGPMSSDAWREALREAARYRVRIERRTDVDEAMNELGLASPWRTAGTALPADRTAPGMITIELLADGEKRTTVWSPR